MCCETLICGTESFLTRCTYNDQTFFQNVLKSFWKEDSENGYFYLCDSFTFNFASTELQDVAKTPDFEVENFLLPLK